MKSPKAFRLGCMPFILAVLAGHAAAADIDGTRPFICAAVEANDCTSGSSCAAGVPREFNVPQFVRVDFAARTLSAEGRTTAIRSATRDDGVLTLQGAEHRRAWSFHITERTGALVGAIAGDDEAFVIFGACTLP